MLAGSIRQVRRPGPVSPLNPIPPGLHLVCEFQQLLALFLGILLKLPSLALQGRGPILLMLVLKKASLPCPCSSH